MRKFRTKLQLYANLWKLILTIVIPTILFSVNGSHCLETLYFKRPNATCDSFIGQISMVSEKKIDKCSNYLPLIVACFGILSGGLCFKLCKVACKILSQVLDFSLSLILSTPITLAIVLSMYGKNMDKIDHLVSCQFPVPELTIKNAAEEVFGLIKDDPGIYAVIAALLGFLSFLLVTNHVWKPGTERLQRTDK